MRLCKTYECFLCRVLLCASVCEPAGFSMSFCESSVDFISTLIVADFHLIIAVCDVTPFQEFMERIAAMKREHQRTMELCDNLGLQPAQTSEFSPQSPSVPVAFVNNNYTLSTMNYSSPAGDLITSSRCVRRPFKARRAPPRRKVEPHTIERRSGSKKKEASNLNEEEQMKMYLMERYLNTYDDNDAIWSDFQDDFSRGPVAGRPAPRLVSFDDSWHPGVTVPKPFSMTVRESLKPRVLSRSMADFERQRDEQANKEHQECNKKFKAAPAPAHIYVPLFEQLSSDRERRRHMNHARRQAELEQLQKPFAFLRREEERQANRQQRQAAFAVADSGVPDANFKAKPFPDHIFNNDAYERIKQQEEIRQEQRLNRAEAMLQLSSLPPNMLKKRPSHCCDMSHESDEERGRSPTRGEYRQ